MRRRKSRSSQRRETEVRQEVKEENEVLAKKRAQQKRRNARADNRVEAAGGGDEEAQVKEQLFRLLLVDNCPRCGFEVERGREADMKEGADEHLKTCDDKKAIAAEKRKEKAVETQEDVMAFKTWEHNGRQVGQLWMP